MMTPSPPSGGGTTHVPPKPPTVPPSGGAGFDAAKSTADFARKTTLNTFKLKIGMPMTTDNTFNPAPILIKLLENIQKVAPDAHITPQKGNNTPIMKPSEVPSSEKLNSFACDLQSNARFKQFNFFVVLRTKFTFNSLKGDNIYLMKWLKENKIWITLHSLQSNHTRSLGFIYAMHPKYAHRDFVTETLKKYLQPFEFALIPTNQFFIKDNKHINVSVVEIHVDADHAEQARFLMVDAISDPNLAAQDFIPNIQKNVMTVATYRSALEQHYNWASDTRAISITGIKNLDETFTRNNHEQTIGDAIMNLVDSDDQPFFISTEPTKFSDSEGRYLLLTSKERIQEAETELDNLTDFIDNNGLNMTLAKPQAKIRRTHRPPTSKYTQHAATLASCYQDIPSPSPPSPPHRHNAWTDNRKRAPVFTFDKENDFPEMTPTRKHTSKKSKLASPDDPADDDATITTLNTNEFTEYMSRLKAIEDNLSTELQAIEHRSQTRANATAKIVEAAAKKQASSHKNTMDTIDFLMRQHNLNEEKNRARDDRSDMIAQVLVQMYQMQAQSNGAAPLPNNLAQALSTPVSHNFPIDNDTQMTNTPDGIGTPGELSNAKRSSADSQGGDGRPL